MAVAEPLSQDEIAEARTMHLDGKSVKEIAEYFGCSERMAQGALHAPAPQRPRSAVGLRDLLFDEIERLQCGDSDPAAASAVANLAQKIINVAKAEVDFSLLQKKETGASLGHLQLGTSRADAAAKATTEASSDTIPDTPASLA